MENSGLYYRKDQGDRTQREQYYASWVLGRPMNTFFPNFN